ncbi:Phosphoribosylglycinamide formyltransferase [Chlamydiales bacterium SCGC AG-110-M15]|nr:Phosphoribosylglycinamide formyltransferase [Chlamydiales bacterium SCGC AG-110-M15]
MAQRIIILISGRGSNMEAILQSSRAGLLQAQCEIVGVISNKPGASGLAIAESYGISTSIVPSKGKSREDFDRELMGEIDRIGADLIVLAGFMRILTPVFIQHYPKRIINIHPADTTAHQGVNGYKWAWEEGLAETFVTVHFVDEGVDTGEVIGKRSVDLRGTSTLEEVEREGLKVEHEFYSEMILSVLKIGIAVT